MLTRTAIAGSCLLLSFAPGVVVAQVWREAMPAAVSGAYCSDTTHGRLLMVGVNAGPGVWGSLIPGTWWFDGSSFELAAPANQGPAGTGLVVHDSLRGMNVYLETGGAVAQTWEHDGSNWAQVATATQPVFPAGDMVFAAHLGVVVVVGTDGSTWHYDGIDWAQQSPAMSPPARRGFALGVDAARQAVVLFGGEITPSQPLQDTWEYDGLTWTQQTPMHLPPAGVARMAFDATLGVMVARISTGNFLDWDWTYDGTDWVQIPILLGSYPWTRPLVTSPTNGRVWWVAYGDDYVVEELNGAAWLPVAGSVRPSARFGGGAAVDPRSDTLMLFGGSFSSPDYPDDDHWIRVGNTWYRHQLNPRPSARMFHGFVHDTARDRFVLFGGYDGTNRLRDTWAFANGQWQWLGNTGPSDRERSAVVYDPVRRRVVLFGGNGTVPLGDLWVLAGSTWSQLMTTGGPSPRYGASMTYDAANDRIVMFGGTTATGPSDETWVLDGANWSLLAGATAPSPRSEAAMAYDPFGGDVVLIGGRAGGTTFSDCWELRDNTWALAAISPSALPRFSGHLVASLKRARLELHRGAVLTSFLGQPYGRPYHDQIFRECGATPRVARHGVGCAASTGLLDLTPATGSVPALGSSFVLELSSLPTSSIAWVALGTRIDHWSGTALPIDLEPIGLSGCHMWIAPSTLDAVAVAGATGSVAVAIPALPALSGAVLAAQGLVLDANAPNGVGAVSNAVVATMR